MAQPTEKINAAIRDCLAHCYGCDKPVDGLAHFVAALRADPAWSEKEVKGVEIAVRRILSAIVEWDGTVPRTELS